MNNKKSPNKDNKNTEVGQALHLSVTLAVTGHY